MGEKGAGGASTSPGPSVNARGAAGIFEGPRASGRLCCLRTRPRTRKRPNSSSPRGLAPTRKSWESMIRSCIFYFVLMLKLLWRGPILGASAEDAT